MMQLSLAGMTVLREVARRGSFTAAAQELGYTQSAISRQVALAEQAAGRPLFDRHARGADLTPAGRIVLRRAAAALAELEAAANELEDLASRRTARVRLGTFSTAMAMLVPRAVATLARGEPRVEVALQEGLSSRLFSGVAAGRLDLAVVTAVRDLPDGVVLDELLRDPLFVAVGREHRLAGLASVEPDKLREENWIAGSADLSSTLLGSWSTGSWRPRIAYEIRDWTAKLGLVAAGCGVTIVPGLARAVLPPTVVAVAIQHPAASRTIALARREGGADRAALDTVSNALRDSALVVVSRLR